MQDVLAHEGLAIQGVETTAEPLLKHFCERAARLSVPKICRKVVFYGLFCLTPRLGAALGWLLTNRINTVFA